MCKVHHWVLTSHPLSWTCSVGAVLVDRYCNPLADITLSSISAQLDEIAEKVKKMLRLKNPSHPTLHVTQGEVFKLVFVFSISCFSSLGDVSLVVIQGTVLRWRTLSSRGRSCAHLTLCCTSSFSTKATSVITTILSTRISTRYPCWVFYTILFVTLAFLFSIQTCISCGFLQVLLRRTGIPISLSVLYMTLAQKLGVHLEPVNFPNHFLLRWCQKPRGYAFKWLIPEVCKFLKPDNTCTSLKTLRGQSEASVSAVFNASARLLSLHSFSWTPDTVMHAAWPREGILWL